MTIALHGPHCKCPRCPACGEHAEKGECNPAEVPAYPAKYPAFIVWSCACGIHVKIADRDLMRVRPSNLNEIDAYLGIDLVMGLWVSYWIGATFMQRKIFQRLSEGVVVTGSITVEPAEILAPPSAAEPPKDN